MVGIWNTLPQKAELSATQIYRATESSYQQIESGPDLLSTSLETPLALFYWTLSCTKHYCVSVQCGWFDCIHV